MLPEPSQATPPLHHLHAKTRWLHRIKEDAPHVVPSLLSSPPRAANGQLHSGHVYNWTSWLDDYGFGKCPDVKKCNVFPDGKPFPQSNDWRRKSYVYVWHTMGGGGLGPLQVLLFAKAAKMTLCFLSPPVVPGQYYETCDGSSSSVTVNTTNIPLGAEVMEVMVYRKRERRKYSPLTVDNAVFYVTGRDTFDPFGPQKQEDSLENSPSPSLSLASVQTRSPWRSTSPRRRPPTSPRTCSSAARTWSSESSSTTPAAT